MIRITGKAVLKSHNDFLSREALSRAKGAYVTVGVHEDAGEYESGVSVVEVALFNEFGTHNIPERSFLRAAFDENVSKINDWRELAIKNMVTKGWTPKQALEMLGFRITTLIQNKIKSNVPPPLAESTEKAKLAAGVAPRTLINSGLLLRSISYKVVT